MSDGELATSPGPSERPPRELAPSQFSIAWLLLLTLWIALCLGMYRMSPVIGAAVGLWTVPAAIRAQYSAQHWKRRRSTISWGDMYDIFGSSLILVAAAELAGLIAFGFAGVVVTVMAGLFGFPLRFAVMAAAAVSLPVGVTAAVVVLWLGRPRRFDKPT